MLVYKALSYSHPLCKISKDDHLPFPIYHSISVSMKNKIQLITYIDRIGCKNLSDLKNLCANELKGLFGTVHLLPFFYPIDGEDAGFDLSLIHI